MNFEPAIPTSRAECQGADMARHLYGNVSRDRFLDLLLDLTAVYWPGDTVTQVRCIDAACEQFDGMTAAHIDAAEH